MAIQTWEEAEKVVAEIKVHAAAVVAENERLRAENEALKADKAWLEGLEVDGLSFKPSPLFPGEWNAWVPGVHETFARRPTLREAIDTAVRVAAKIRSEPRDRHGAENEV